MENGDIELKVVDCMSESPITVEAAKRMPRNRIDSLPVVEHGKLAGILAISDVLDVFIEQNEG